MPTWVWMVRQKRDEAMGFLAEAISRGDADDIAYGERWVHERQQTLGGERSMSCESRGL